MTFDDWRDAVSNLRSRCGPPDDAQRELAQKLGFELPSDVSAPVAAALLRERLAEPLRDRGQRPATIGQQEYLDDLCEDLGIVDRDSMDISTHARASAWIEVLESRRAADALEQLKPLVGDIVESIYRTERRGAVASISASGRINLAGAGGRGLPAHTATIVLRAAATGAAAEDVRRDVANRRARAARSQGLSVAKATRLERWAVDEVADAAQLVLLRETIDSADDEKPIQELLGRHPHLLGALLGGHHGRWVRPKVQLARNYEADFMVAQADSNGIHWWLVELESPRAAMFLANGEFAEKARHGVDQIRSWRAFLQDNLDLARRPTTEHGLDLVDIDPRSPGIVLIGRRDALGKEAMWRRRQMREDQDIFLRSYDWLVGQIERRVEGWTPWDALNDTGGSED